MQIRWITAFLVAAVFQLQLDQATVKRSVRVLTEIEVMGMDNMRKVVGILKQVVDAIHGERDNDDASGLDI